MPRPMPQTTLSETRRHACALGLLLAWALASLTLAPAEKCVAADPPVSASATDKTAVGSPAKNPTPQTVQLIVDYGDGAQWSLSAIPWRKGMTGLDLLAAVKNHPHGVTFETRGSGERAFVAKIADLANQGSGQGKKNWLYSVGGKQADVGIGGFQPQPGDVVLWKYAVYDYTSEE